MKLETSEAEREEAKRWYNKDAFKVRSSRDIDTLLAEVERLRAAPPAPPLPAEVEEMRKRLERPQEWGYRCLAEGPFFNSDPAPFEAASLLSRWPGVSNETEGLRKALKLAAVRLDILCDRMEGCHAETGHHELLDEGRATLQSLLICLSAT